MRKTILLIITVLILIGASATVSLGYEELYYLNTGDLYREPHKYDKVRVAIKGEVIGDVIKAQGTYWVNINDDVYARKSIAEGSVPRGQNSGIGVALGKDLLKKIEHTGDYFQKGDVVEVQGIFNESCSEHGGEMDIHAESLKIIKEGYPIRHEIKPGLVIAAGILFLVVIIGYLLRYYFITRPGFRRKIF